MATEVTLVLYFPHGTDVDELLVRLPDDAEVIECAVEEDV